MAPVSGVQVDAPAPGPVGGGEACLNPTSPERGHTVWMRQLALQQPGCDSEDRHCTLSMLKQKESGLWGLC
ncbi:unnamed protein product [Rangifer tarandus platyrhynchus]|uniref:Uncharacterized protein n=1 Tax=Rangifer tarandus platyrhynchus TaxID=3082113 RepID=A0AC59ZPM7_RANTA